MVGEKNWARRPKRARKAAEATGDLFFQPSPETLALREARRQANLPRNREPPPKSPANLRQQMVGFLRSEPLIEALAAAATKGTFLQKTAAMQADTRRRALLEALGEGRQPAALDAAHNRRSPLGGLPDAEKPLPDESDEEDYRA